MKFRIFNTKANGSQWQNSSNKWALIITDMDQFVLMRQVYIFKWKPILDINFLFLRVAINKQSNILNKQNKQLCAISQNKSDTIKRFFSLSHLSE